jgi:hypothetical protein
MPPQNRKAGVRGQVPTPAVGGVRLGEESSPQGRATGRDVNAARRFNLCAQTEEPPFYKYVSVEGPVVGVAPAELEADRRPLAPRYFGPELGDAYVSSTDEEGRLKFSMRPTRWWSVDHTKLS